MTHLQATASPQGFPSEPYVSMSDAAEAARMQAGMQGIGMPIYDEETDVARELHDMGLFGPVGEG